MRQYCVKTRNAVEGGSITSVNSNMLMKTKKSRAVAQEKIACFVSTNWIFTCKAVFEAGLPFEIQTSQHQLMKLKPYRILCKLLKSAATYV